ncbi:MULTISPECIES: CoA-transferase [Clostridium]|uniref:acyl CoA:acetate/3-ketoacid CoA transferase n=1 Tax=Clostridium TaxID=1485 RepID=UPI0029049D8E|nr:CoA-transferase [Clostridium sp.]MDU1338426.1 CoA-transferase [Clostridium butyricum]MDU4588063.1 CoA-transferase [Clostridium sp.]MDU5100970.1 CoA-transferase [Clostridium butyricum]MDU6540146.1 CoA-transferase [Clostridium sp.]
MIKFIDCKEAVLLLKNNDVVAVSGFAGLAVPESLLKTLEERYIEEGYPNNLTLMFAAAQGDGKSKGLNHLAHKGLVKRVIGGHFNLAPKLAEMMNNNIIEGYNLPQGVMCNIFRDISRKSGFTLSKVGLGTFVDPRIEGGKVNSISKEKIVELFKFNGEEFLLYHHQKIDIALIKGSYCDENGNISLDNEATYSEAFLIAQAVKNSGGIVIVQVDKVVSKNEMKCKSVKIPKIYVDYIVEVLDKDNKEQVLGLEYNPFLTAEYEKDKKDFAFEEREENRKSQLKSEKNTLDARKIIGRRAAMELSKGDIVNIGIGIPEEVSSIAYENGFSKMITLTVEPGPIGGIPQSGKGFGASLKAECILDQISQFDFYDGGGLDIAFLGMAECDKMGNINVSKFGTRLAGCGGFINITQNTKKIIFCGTFTAKGLEINIRHGKMFIENEGKNKKFKTKVQQITFSGEKAKKYGQEVIYITERAVFKLKEDGIYLTEAAPGIDIEKDIINQMDFKPFIDKNFKVMDEKIFL